MAWPMGGQLLLVLLASAAIQATEPVADGPPPPSGVNTELGQHEFEDLREALGGEGAQPDWARVMEEGRKLRLGTEVTERSLLGAYFETLALRALGRDEESIAVCDEVLGQISSGDGELWKSMTAYFMLFRGQSLARLQHLRDALAAFDALIARFATDPDPEIEVRVGEALTGKAWIYDQQSRFRESAAASSEVLSRFGDRTSEDMQRILALALGNKAAALIYAGRRREALAAWTELETRFGTSSNPSVQVSVATGLNNRAEFEWISGNVTGALTLRETLIGRYGTSDSPLVQRELGRAFHSNGFLLGSLGRNEEAIAAYDVTITRLGSSSSPAVLHWVARSMNNKGVMLAALGRHDEAIEVFEAVDERFRQNPSTGIHEAVVHSLINRVNSMAATGRIEEAIGAMNEWASVNGTFDCRAVRQLENYRTLRRNPRSAQVLRLAGCR